MSAKTVIENLVNGNLQDAKVGARRVASYNLERTAIEEFGFSEMKAARAAIYLKLPSEFTYQQYCDAK